MPLLAGSPALFGRLTRPRLPADQTGSNVKVGFQSRCEVPVELHGQGRFVLPRKEFVPAYVKAYEQGKLAERVAHAVESLRSCRVCPRDCRIDRLHDRIGVCRSGRRARVASAFAHFGEEDCLRGWNGSGTIFFSGCNLRCVCCQNFETSQLGEGHEVTAEELAAVMLELQAAGCHNLNVVTPEDVVPHGRPVGLPWRARRPTPRGLAQRAAPEAV
jgi:putative pyruvate formate lyase activating enzyme